MPAVSEIPLGGLILQPRRQLLANGTPLPLRKKPLAVLSVLAEAAGSLVTKDELIEAIWPGQIVEESALQVHIVALRKALGVEADRLKTVHGIGYRLEVPPGAAGTVRAIRSDQPSIAILPLRILNCTDEYAFVAEALPHELIAELSRLRWLFVIARASSFRFRDSEPDMAHVGAALGVKYCLSGTMEQEGREIAATFDLVDTQSQRVVWGHRYAAPIERLGELRAAVVKSIIAALEFHIPVHEATLAGSSVTENLDAWSLYHLALQRVFRSTRVDNAAALALFAQAVARDPTFARAHAGLSFTHFQNAFMHYVRDRDAEAAAATRAAERALDLDAADPFANLVFGRAHWLNGDMAESLPWIERALTLNPNYAQAAYAHAFADVILCDGAEGQRQADHAMALSSIDPMHYAMLASRALSHAVRGEYGMAAAWSDRAARAPNSHVLITMIAMVCHTLAGRTDQARQWASVAKKTAPQMGKADFFRAFPFHDGETARAFSGAFASLR